ncbi:hypothetical protein [Aeromicrobium sp. UC242_57]|uniref:hypothetical protein n=1 Tax=Aeromicrobium sp. UC242_57 TaxID=3374624 RepID=UPI0037BBEBAD
MDVADLPVFVALSAWRWAIIVEGIQQRLSAGHMHAGRDVATDVSAEAAWHRRRVELLADFAADLLD